MDAAPYWFPVVTLIAGAGLAHLNERWRDRRRRGADRESARRAFELDALVALQDAVARQVRAAFAVQHRDEMEFRRSGAYGRQLLPDDLDKEERMARVDVHRYRVRVLDEAIRERSNELAKVCTEATFRDPGVTDAEARRRCLAALEVAIGIHAELETRLGARIRELA